RSRAAAGRASRCSPPETRAPPSGSCSAGHSPRSAWPRSAVFHRFRSPSSDLRISTAEAYREDMAQQTTLLILGASGDLTSRLLLPAIGQLLKREPERRLTLHGAGSDDWSAKRWTDSVRASFAASDAEDQVARVSGTTYTQADVTDHDALAALVEGVQGRLVIYFALPPAVTEKACEVLRDVTLPENTVLALEKPFGSDE